MTTHSSLYTGVLRHRRLGPTPHSFDKRIYMAYLDLDEVPGVLDALPLWSARRAAPVRFRRSDHLGDPAAPLADAVRDEVADRLGFRPTGAVRVLTVPRTLGWGFNPITVFYCFSASERLEAVVLEVTNTPWGDRHIYVLEATAGAVQAVEVPKAMHVSPFMPMDLTYRISCTRPGASLAVRMDVLADGVSIFDAELVMARRALTPTTSTTVLLRHPAMALGVSVGIYRQALALLRKRTPLHARAVEHRLPEDSLR